MTTPPTPSQPSSREVRIVEVPAIPVAVLEHHGSPQTIDDTIRRFIAWRRRHGLLPSRSATFNLLYDGPEQVDPAQFRLDLCAAIDGPLPDDELPVTARTIPAGRRAVLRHLGSDDTLEDTLRYLCGTWLPASGETRDDFPLYLQRVRMGPEVPEHEAVTEVFLPLR